MVLVTRRLSGGQGVCVLWSMRTIYPLPITTLAFGETRAKIFCCAGRANALFGCPISAMVASSSHVASTIQPLRTGKSASIPQNLMQTSERFCAEPSNTPCLWLVRRRFLTTNRMRESKASHLRSLARQKHLAFRTSIFFLHFARMTPINGKWGGTTALIQEVRAIPRWRVL